MVGNHAARPGWWGSRARAARCRRRWWAASAARVWCGPVGRGSPGGTAQAARQTARSARSRASAGPVRWRAQGGAEVGVQPSCVAGEGVRQVADPCRPGLEVRAPVGVVPEAGGEVGEPGQGAAGEGGEPVVEDGGGVAGVAQAGLVAGLAQERGGVGAVEGVQGQLGTERGPRGLVRQARVHVVGLVVDPGRPGGAEDGVGGEAHRVVVAGGGVGELPGGVVEVALGGGGGGGCVVAVEEPGELFEGGGGQHGVGVDGGVRVAVGGGDEVEVVAGAAAGEGDVEQRAVLGAGEDGVGGVDGHALGAVDGGGVAELDVLACVAGGQAQGAVQVEVPGVDGAVAVDLGDAPPVAVLDPVGAVRGAGSGRCGG